MSVKVAVRVRPFNAREQGSTCCIRMVSTHSIQPSFAIYRMAPKLSLSTTWVEIDPSLSITRSGRTMDSR